MIGSWPEGVLEASESKDLADDLMIVANSQDPVVAAAAKRINALLKELRDRLKSAKVNRSKRGVPTICD